MVDHRATPRYHSYLLRFWQERGRAGDNVTVWRFSLEDPHTQVRHGFASLDELVAAMVRDMDGAPDSEGVYSLHPSALILRLMVQEDTMQTDPLSEDEVAIRATIEAVEAGWNAGDGDAFAAPFAADADYVIIDGRQIKGREAIAQGHQQIFSTVYKGSHNCATIRDVRLLRDDVAVAHVEWHLKFGQPDARREGRALNTMVLMKDESTWRITAFQNTPLIVG